MSTYTQPEFPKPSSTDSTSWLPSDLSSYDVLNALSSHVAVIDRHGVIVAINKAWELFASTNDSSTELVGVGSNYLDTCKKAIRSDNEKLAFQALQGIEQVLAGKTQEFELEYPCHSPEQERWFVMRSTLIQNTQHAVICHIDITEKKLTEKALNEREEELLAFHLIHRQVASQIELEPVIRTILEQIRKILKPDLAMLFLKDGKTLLLKEAIPSYPTTFCHENEPHEVGKCLCGIAVQSGRAIYSYDITTDERCERSECKNAGYRSFASIPLINDSEILGCIGITSTKPRDFSERSDFLNAAAKDVTLSLKNALLYDKLQHYAEDIQNQLHERERLEKILVQNQKLEAIGHLAGGVAHDFNNILAAIMGYAELALRNTESTSIKEYLQGSLKACHRAKDLIQQILTFSRKSDTNLMPLDLRFILKESLLLVRASLPSTITVHEQLDSISSATIRGNPNQLQRVFMNLCSNAAQSIDDANGVLIIKLTEVIVDQNLRERCPDLKLDRRYVELSVRDTGVGIAAEHLASIFEPYFSTKVPGKGTGLGLAVVHGIVKHHHGGVIVDSFPGHGTTFSLYFPLIDAPLPTIVSKSQQPSPRGAGHILIVDDEAAIVQVLEKTLQNKGYTTTSSQFAQEAMILFRKSPAAYDLVLCDLTMPDITGDILAKKMKEIRNDIPVILCSGHSAERLQGLNTAEIDKILQKPIPHTELIAAVRELLKEDDSPPGQD